MKTASGWLFLFVSTIASAASPPPEQACTAQPPIVKGGPIIWCNGQHTPPILGDNTCGATPEAAAREWLGVTSSVNGSGSLCGPCTVSGSDSTVAVCKFQTAHTFPCGDRDAPPGIQFNSTVSSCPAGYEPNASKKYQNCVDKGLKKDDEITALNGIVYDRDDSGNILSAYKLVPSTGRRGAKIAEFGKHDAFGRPWEYSEGAGDVIGLEWPDGGGCLPSAILHKGWRSALTWADSEHVATISTPSGDRKALYSFNYYPDADVDLHMATTEIALHDSRLLITRAYSEEGNEIGHSTKFLPPATTAATSAAVAPRTSVAAPQPAPDPYAVFFQPKVVVARPVPGGTLGPQLLGVQMLLLPVFDLLGQQIGRFFASTLPTQQELMAACAQRLHGEYGRCEAAVSDQFGARPWPPEVEAEKQDCDKSARERHRFCLAGQIAIAPPLRLPTLTGSEAQHKCESAAWQQYQNDKATCEGQYPQGGAQLVDCYQRALQKYDGTKAACKGK